MNKVSRKAMKVLSIVLMILMVFCYISPVFADGYLDQNLESKNSTLADEMLSKGGKIYGVFQVAGIIVATIMLVVLAIKYLTSSPQDKADVKKSAFIYIFGAILLYAASGVMEIIKQAAGLFGTK